jgi:hypothetical protein
MTANGIVEAKKAGACVAFGFPMADGSIDGIACRGSNCDVIKEGAMLNPQILAALLT